MANPEHLAILKQGVEVWNKWREENPEIKPDLSQANLRGENLRRADLNEVNLSGTKLSEADLSEAHLSKANLSGVNLTRARLFRADLSGADLWRTNLRETISGEANLSGANLDNACLNSAFFYEANLSGAILNRAYLIRVDLGKANLSGAILTKALLIHANLSEADLTEADLTEADLRGTRLTLTKLNGANLSGCKIFGISVWDTELINANQKDLIITQDNEPVITVDNLEVAQFVYLLLNNEKIRHVIDTITSKVVLILGRFTEERKAVLGAIRDELRRRNYTPVLFDFDKPSNKDLTETISTLAHMARFIIADITDPRCIPHELATIVPTLSVPVKPLLLKGATVEYAMFRDLSKYPWVMTIYRYKNSDELIQSLEAKVIAPAEKKATALIKSKNR